MKIVFALSTASVTMPGGWTMLVTQGSHWPANDPLVERRPELFSDDPMTGIQHSAFVRWPEDEQEELRAGV